MAELFRCPGSDFILFCAFWRPLSIFDGNKLKIAIISKSFCQNADLISLAEEQLLGHRLMFNKQGEDLNPRQLAELCTDFQVLLIGRESIDLSTLGKNPAVKIIVKYGVGMDNIDMAACESKGVTVLAEPGVNRDGVAEFTVGLMINLLRNIAIADRYMRNGEWRKSGGYQLTGKTVGIVGLGHVGTRVAELLSPFRCRVLANDILDKSLEAKQLGCEMVSFDALLETADIVTLHVPLDESTTHMIDRRCLTAMGSEAYLINTSRGPVINTHDLIEALNQGHIAGAALDVFSEEPLGESPLLNCPGTLLTAHMAGNSREAVWDMGRAAIRLLKQYLN
jgi:phosphoglycerate dehydrogenase-like enzyme